MIQVKSKSKSKEKSKSKSKSRQRKSECVWVVSESTGREAPNKVLTVVELMGEGVSQLGLPRGAARRT